MSMSKIPPQLRSCLAHLEQLRFDSPNFSVAGGRWWAPGLKAMIGAWGARSMRKRWHRRLHRVGYRNRFLLGLRLKANRVARSGGLQLRPERKRQPHPENLKRHRQRQIYYSDDVPHSERQHFATKHSYFNPLDARSSTEQSSCSNTPIIKGGQAAESAHDQVPLRLSCQTTWYDRCQCKRWA